MLNLKLVLSNLYPKTLDFLRIVFFYIPPKNLRKENKQLKINGAILLAFTISIDLTHNAVNFFFLIPSYKI